MKIEFDIFNREFFGTLTFSLKFQKKAQVSIIYMTHIMFLLPSCTTGTFIHVKDISKFNDNGNQYKQKLILWYWIKNYFLLISGVKWQSGTWRISRDFLVSNRETNDFSTSVRSSQGGAVWIMHNNERNKVN
jgi:hypothetical protein